MLLSLLMELSKWSFVSKAFTCSGQILLLLFTSEQFEFPVTCTVLVLLMLDFGASVMFQCHPPVSEWD